MLAAAHTITRMLADLPGVMAVTLGGSVQSGLADAASDLDLHVFWQTPLADAQTRLRQLATIADPDSVQVDIHSWGLEDHLVINGRPVELIYVRWSDFAAEVAYAYDVGLYSDNATTARLFYAAHGGILCDPTGEFAATQQHLHTFPEATYRVLLARQPALLRVFLEQLVRAQGRSDWLFVQHCRTKIQLAFFNLLFTLNRQYHPGEKRLLHHLARCPIAPAECGARWTQVTRYSTDDPALSTDISAITDDLLALVAEQGFDIDAPSW